MINLKACLFAGCKVNRPGGVRVTSLTTESLLLSKCCRIPLPVSLWLINWRSASPLLKRVEINIVKEQPSDFTRAYVRDRFLIT